MKIAKRNAGDEHAVSVSGGITDDSYAARCSSFIRARGGNSFVIRSIEGMDGSLATKQPATEAQWIAWMYYFSWREIPHRYAKTRGMTTVPCEWPEEFDRDALESDRSARIPAPKSYAGPEKLSEIARGLRALGASLAVTDHRKKRTDVGAMSKVEAERHLDALAARYAGKQHTPLGGIHVQQEGAA